MCSLPSIQFFPYLVLEWHDLLLERVHGDDVLLLVVEVDVVDAGEELLQVRLDHGRLRRLAQDLKEVVVADEVEPEIEEGEENLNRRIEG